MASNKSAHYKPSLMFRFSMKCVCVCVCMCVCMWVYRHLTLGNLNDIINITFLLLHAIAINISIFTINIYNMCYRNYSTYSFFLFHMLFKLNFTKKGPILNYATLPFSICPIELFLKHIYLPNSILNFLSP